MKSTSNQPFDSEPIPVEAVLFDVGGTLIEPWPSVGHIYADVAKESGWKDVDSEKLNQQFSAAWKSKTDFHYSPEHWKELVIKTFEGMVPLEACLELFPKLYERFEDPRVWKIHEDVLPALDELASRGFRLGIVSNWDTRLKPLLNQLKLGGFFELVTVSCDIGFTKPSPVIFEHTISKLGLPANRLLHVGDQGDEDLEGANAAGLHSLLIQRKSPTTSRSIQHLTELSRRITEAWSQ